MIYVVATQTGRMLLDSCLKILTDIETITDKKEKDVAKPVSQEAVMKALRYWRQDGMSMGAAATKAGISYATLYRYSKTALAKKALAPETLEPTESEAAPAPQAQSSDKEVWALSERILHSNLNLKDKLDVIARVLKV